MSRVPFPAAARPARSVASSPAVAGFRPAGAALAVAAVFALQPLAAGAQAVGPQVIQGSATFARSGGNLVVTTHNAAGSNFSAINWQSFSVPAGTVTRFDQPSATSTSINRVVGSDPSAIFGTLSSNGRLVLVNPAGITVGQGAVVDTAAFTASTLKMSDADAMAGRLAFGASTGGLLQVDGHVIAHSGDVVLVAPQLQTGPSALVQSHGATVLAAGHKVEITGRGLEGIQMEVQAGDQAVNLGTLQGDAVGIFAGTLHHSGVIQAQAVSTEGGKVVLKASGGDALVDGAITAGGLDGHGGAIDVLGQRVGLLAGASVDASGAAGGGQVRIGGDYQGRNASVPNAARTYVDAQATIRADATQQGEGGRVIVWSDEATRMDGRISARAGALGGNGGFIEVSSRQYLGFGGGVDLSAPHGKNGTLLLDPDDITITATGPDAEPEGSDGNGGTQFGGGTGSSTISAGTLNSILADGGNVLVSTSGGSRGPQSGQITLDAGATLSWSGTHSLGLAADAGIQLNGKVQASSGTLSLVAQNGSITQGGASTLDVDSLYASAAQGSVTLTATGNQIRQVAGQADGGAFSLTSTGPLTIGSVTAGPASSPYASGTGIAAAGDVSIAVNDAVTIAPGAAVSGGSITLVAGGAGFTSGSGSSLSATDPGGAVSITSSGKVDFGTGSAAVSTNHGRITITAATDILGNVDLSTWGSDDASGLAGSVSMTATGGSLSYGSISTGSDDFALHGGNVTLQAAHDVQGGDIVANGGSGSLGAGAGGTVSISSSGGSIQVAGVTTYGGTAPASMGSPGGGAGGNVTMTASQGSVSVASIEASGGSSENGPGGNGANVTLTAGGDIDVVSEGYGIDVQGGASGGGQGGAGGKVSLVSTGGGINVYGMSDTLATSSTAPYGGGIIASGGSGATSGDGGNILLSAKGDVTISEVDAYSYGGSGGAGGQGGTVSLVSTGGNVVVNDVEAWGGDTYLSSEGVPATGDAGAGGRIVISAKSGSVWAQDVDVSGGYAAEGGRAGDGGTIQVTAGKDVAISALWAYGGEGYASVGSASGGAGGSISLQALGGDLTLGRADLGGGYGVDGTGGAGGTLQASASGAATIGSVFAAGGSTSGTGAAGDGGIVSVRAGGDIDLSAGYGESPELAGIVSFGVAYGASVSVDGGSSDQGQGGRGGAVSLLSTGGGIVASGSSIGPQLAVVAAAVPSGAGISANGGTGASAGQGGNVSLAAASGIDVANVTADGGMAMGPGQTGGAGGSISLTASSGNLSLDGTLLSARGGDGGSATRPSTGAGGVGGAGGSISLAAPAGAVVLGNVQFDTSGGIGGVAGDGTTVAATGAMGTLAATGQSVEVQGNVELDAQWSNATVVNAGGTSSVTGSGSLRNTGTLNLRDTASFVPDGGVDNQAGGQIVTGSGAAVTANLLRNAGTVDVTAGSTLSVPVSFTNQAAGLLTGTGTVSVAGGDGTITNFGTIAPGGSGVAGTLSIQGKLAMESGSTLAMDVFSPASYDVLSVSGVASTGGTVAVSYQPTTALAAGDRFQLLQAGTLDAATLPGINVPELAWQAGPTVLAAVANAPYPAPAPSAQAPAAQQMANQVVTFAQLFVQEAQNQDGDHPQGRDDIVITGNACKP